MIPAGFRPARVLPIAILIAFVMTAAYQVLSGPVRDADPDAAVMLFILFVIAVIVFLVTGKYDNFRLQTGLALIIYALGVDVVEEFTRDFHHTETILLTIVLVAGFILLISGIFISIRRVDQNIDTLRRNERELRARTEELAAAAAAREKANDKLRLLAQITRHDIGNRLLTASAYVMIAQEAERSEEIARYLVMIEQSLGAIRETTAFTKTYEEIGLDPSRWQGVRILIDAAASQLKREDVTIESSVDMTLEIYSDAMIGRVFVNLIDNALAHGGPSLGRIRFSAGTRGNDVVIVCENDGEGIPVKEKERIFSQGVGKHTGFGLFLAREILSITGISIRENGDPNRGARFEILVPPGTWRYGSGDSPDPSPARPGAAGNDPS